MTNPNPLRDPDDRRLGRIAGPSGLIIFGVTGDLARKKLIPAVYDLANRGLLPPGFALVGFARRDWSNEEFIAVVHESVKEYARTPFREDVWAQLSAGIRFVSGDFDDNDAFDRLGDEALCFSITSRKPLTRSWQDSACLKCSTATLPPSRRASFSAWAMRSIRRATCVGSFGW